MVSHLAVVKTKSHMLVGARRAWCSGQRESSACRMLATLEKEKLSESCCRKIADGDGISALHLTS